jgi:hypothetical protein
MLGGSVHKGIVGTFARRAIELRSTADRTRQNGTIRIVPFLVIADVNRGVTLDQ